MIGLDNDAAVADFQTNPLPANLAHRERVRAYLRAHPLRILFPSVALSEYLFRIDRPDLDADVRRVVADRMFVPAFDEVTAEVAAGLARRYAAGRSLAAVEREVGSDRVALKSDLMIVATAVQHAVQHFVTADEACYRMARFAGLNAVLVGSLPDPPPERPGQPPPAPGGGPKSLFDDLPPDTPAG